MSNYFNPEDVITKDGIVSNITRNGAGFISTKEGEDVFVPIRLVQTSGIEMGDSVTVYMVKNFGDATLKNISDSASFRALRVVITARLGMGALPQTYSALPVAPAFLDSVSNPFHEIVPVVKPKLTSAVLRQAVDACIEGGFIGTSAMMHGELVKTMPDYDLMADDNGLRVKMDISSLLHRLHDEGLIAQARICTAGDQKNSSYTVYGPTAKGLFNAIIGA